MGRPLRAAAGEMGFDLDDPSVTVFDFGCGFGRTSRHWGRPVRGSDVQAELVEWCQQHLRRRTPSTIRSHRRTTRTRSSMSSRSCRSRISPKTGRPGGWASSPEWSVQGSSSHSLPFNASAASRSPCMVSDYRDGRIVVCYPRQEGEVSVRAITRPDPSRACPEISTSWSDARTRCLAGTFTCSSGGLRQAESTRAGSARAGSYDPPWLTG